MLVGVYAAFTGRNDSVGQKTLKWILTLIKFVSEAGRRITKKGKKDY